MTHLPILFPSSAVNRCNMKHNFLTPVLIFAVGIHLVASQESDMDDSLAPLSAEEADAIVQEEAKVKADKKARRRAFLMDQSKFKVIEQKEIFTGQKKLTFNRLEPSLLDPLVTQQPEIAESVQPQEQLSEAEMQQILLEHSQKEQLTLMLSATVYDHEFSELRWHHEGQQYIAWSNVDFNYLRVLTEIETEKANYLFFLSISNESTEKIEELNELAKEKGSENYIQESIPELPEFTKGIYEYFVVAQDDTIKRSEDAYIPVDALHDYYAENEKHLKIEYKRNEALHEARKRYKDQHPKKPDEPIINFWPGRGSVYQKPETK